MGPTSLSFLGSQLHRAGFASNGVSLSSFTIKPSIVGSNVEKTVFSQLDLVDIFWIIIETLKKFKIIIKGNHWETPWMAYLPCITNNLYKKISKNRLLLFIYFMYFLLFLFKRNVKVICYTSLKLFFFFNFLLASIT